jgi:SAM-dependent methyltransferase
MTSYEKVTTAWHRIHAEHPEIYHIANPGHISRMKRRDFTKIVDTTCNLEAGAAVLEAGCGSGRDSLFFSYLGHHCTAIDINISPLEKLKRARATLSTNCIGNPLQLSLECGDIFQLPYRDNTFDFVFNSGVVEHYDEPTRLRLIAEMVRVTRPGRCVSVVFPNKDHVLDKFWSSLIRTWTDFDSYDIPEQPLGSAFVYSLRNVGLDVLLFDWIDCYDTFSHFPGWLPLRAVSYIAASFLPRPPRGMRRRTGTRAVIVATKRI